jgi:hypothetical protein
VQTDLIDRLGADDRNTSKCRQRRPVNGEMKEARGFRHFSMRGVHGEWALVCIAQNLLKLAGRTR